jgi:hypothetical protein
VAIENENPEGRAGVVLKGPRRGFVLATISFISGYGSQVSVAAIKWRATGSAACAVWGVSSNPRSRWGLMYILFHAVMIGILGTTMYRFVDWFEPNRRLAKILKILVLVTGALALAQLPTWKKLRQSKSGLVLPASGRAQLRPPIILQAIVR